MFDRLKNVVTRYDDLTQQMADPAVLGDMARLQQVAREQRELEAVVTAYQRYERLSQQLSEAQQLINDTDDADLRTMAQDEIAELTPVRTDLEAQLKLLLLPRDPNDERSVIMELRQGEGGDESALFAADLFRMYSRCAERVGWKVEVVNSSENGIGGFKEISFEIHGDGAYSRLKYEGGVHRVQRVPATEARGRIHTSTATVAVLPKLDEDGRPAHRRLSLGWAWWPRRQHHRLGGAYRLQRWHARRNGGDVSRWSLAAQKQRKSHDGVARASLCHPRS